MSKETEELLSRYVDTVYPSKDAFLKYLKSKKKIKIYIGLDPTGPDLHLGHTTNFLFLKKFQELGHKIIILVGDFTAQIGDPTDKLAQRVPLTREQTIKNAETYKNQVAKILDFKSKENPVEMAFNSKWLDKLTYKEVIQLSSNFTVQQMLKRDMFEKRIQEGKPIGVHEFLYPVTVGYDCVVLDVDLEVGGTDQTFNMLMGRDLMKSLKKKEKFVITTPLLINPKTDKKIMSKSEGQYVAVNDSPQEMFGKIMALPDEVLLTCFEQCTEISIKEIAKIEKELADGKNPKEIKVRLAKEIVTMYHDENEAKKAEEEFNNIFAKKEKPEDVEVKAIERREYKLADLIFELEMSSSKSEARRLIEQGAVRIDDAIIGDREAVLTPMNKMIVQVGKRKFIQLKVQS